VTRLLYGHTVNLFNLRIGYIMFLAKANALGLKQMHCSDWIWNGPSVVIWASKHIRGERLVPLKQLFRLNNYQKFLNQRHCLSLSRYIYFSASELLSRTQTIRFLFISPHRLLSLLIRSYHFHTSESQLQLLNPFWCPSGRHSLSCVLHPISFTHRFVFN